MRRSKLEIESESSHWYLYMKCEICDRDIDHSRYRVLPAVAGQVVIKWAAWTKSQEKQSKKNTAADSSGSVCQSNTTMNSLGGISW